MLGWGCGALPWSGSRWCELLTLGAATGTLSVHGSWLLDMTLHWKDQGSSVFGVKWAKHKLTLKYLVV